MMASTQQMRRALRLIGLLGVLASGACSGSGHDGGGPTDMDPPTMPVDQVSNGLIELDEAALTAQPDGDELDIAIPVRALRKTAGKLEVTLQDLTGEHIFGHVTVDYALERNAATMLHAVVGATPLITSQAQLAERLVRIEQSGERPLRVRKSLFHMVPLSEMRLEGPGKLRADKQAVYRALVQDPRTREPRVDQVVELLMRDADGQDQTLTAKTDETGSAVFELTAKQAGEYKVSASTEIAGTQVDLSGDVTVEAVGQKVLLTTDKPIYQPGQVIHLRALALRNPGNQPIKDEDVTVEIEDGKGNKVMKRTLTTSAHGIAATDFTLANIVNMGTFKVRAVSEGATTEKTVEVSRYVLPKLDVSIAVDREFYTAGAHVSGSLNARYFFGRDVAGASVQIEALTLDVGENVFQRVMGMTDASGDMSFALDLPRTLVGLDINSGNALVTIRATVTDTAGQVVVKEKALTVAPSAVRIALVPEATSVVPGIENRLHVFASDPLGGPIPGASVEVASDGQSIGSGETDAYGHLELRWTPAESASPSRAMSVSVDTGDGPATTESFDLSQQLGGEHVLVRTDKSIYKVGETVNVEIRTSADESVAYVDWLNEGQAIDMRTLTVQDGVARFSMPVDIGLIGGNRIEAYVVDADGVIARAGRSIVAQAEGGLSVSLKTDKKVYTPGAPASLTFSVVDEQGEPAVAALGVQIVDEAVFALIDARPGLLKTYFELEDSFATPDYEIRGPVTSFESLLFAQPTDDDAKEASQVTTEASLAALRNQSMFGVQAESWTGTESAAKALVTPYFNDDRTRLVAIINRAAKAALVELQARGCDTEEWFCNAIGMSLGDALIAQLEGQTLDSDFWGRPFTLQRANDVWGVSLISRGPDEQASNEDDQSVSVALGDLGLVSRSGGTDTGIDFDQPEFGNGAGMGAFPAGGGTGGTGGGFEVPTDPVAEDDGDGDSGGGPRVRREFPETLYVNPSLITDEEGQATVELDMADSITEWRVSALANAASGKLGGAQSGIRVFQDFFADVSFPAELTRGDEVEVPVVVYNYLDEPQSVRLQAEAADWYTPLGSVENMLELAAGEVRSVRFPVRVDAVGTQTFTVRAFGTDASDAVARTVRVVPDGQAVPTAQSGALEPGDVTLSAVFPADAVAGSQQLYVDIYPAYLAQAVAGLDSILMEPNGCFEQTTSTTWPNVLVTRYMQETGLITTEIQLKAEALISTGYQRLLTFEHQGGGFSWFGEQDPAPYLSVTAFGLMEFADMAGVAEVDAAMIERTQAWLLSQQQPDGSWLGDQTEFFSFQASTVRNTAFTAWALAQNGYTGDELGRALDYVKANLGDDEMDVYTLALAANAFALAAPSDSFTGQLFDRLDAMKSVSGDKISWNAGATQTDFYASGDDATVTSTALVAHALLIAGESPESVAGALNYLIGSKDANGNFGSTQATVWTLKTLLLSALKGTSGAVGTLDVSLDGSPFATVELTEDQSDVMTRIDMSALATTGAHQVELAFVGTGKVSYGLVSQHNVPWGPFLPSTGPLAITVGYDRTQLGVEETVEATVSITNTSASAQKMVLVTVGLPPGFDLLSEDVDALVSSHLISHYEKTGKQLILYLTDLPALSTLPLSYRLRATMPVRAVDGGAEARLYYEPEKIALAGATLLTSEM